MTFNDAQARFSVRYYRWAREEFQSEVEGGFPLLKRLNTRASAACLSLMERLAIKDQIKFADALLKRFHTQAIECIGDCLSKEEEDLVHRYTNSILMAPQGGTMFWGQSQREGPPLELSRKSLAATVKRYLAPVLSHAPENRGGGNLRYNNRISGFQVHTNLDFGGRFHRLCYSHDIVFSGYDLLVQSASVESWLGLSSQTLWSHLDESEAEKTAHLVAELCAHFCFAVPKLVDGIFP